ncbi:sensor histidine kinase [Planctomicrobium sp. SH527]|uniref:sensor histidine kinase n=1 Tax=Planctomicrobium sp. SH527 TaxID=3448123 RepID=UPI003F5C3DA5
MADNLKLFAYGAAAVLDLVLLLSLLERPNWRSVTSWMLSLTIGICLWHSGLFIHALLVQSPDELAVHGLWASMTAMAAGLLIMPSAMMHGLHRFTKSGMQVSIRMNPWLCLYYLPVLLLIPISFQLATDPRVPFLQLLNAYAGPYLVWMSGTNLVAAFGLLQLRRSIESPSVLRFFNSLAWTLLGITIVDVSCLTWGLQLWPEGRVWLQMIVALSPVLPALVFSYYVMRFKLLPLVLERTLIYGAIVVGAMLLHEAITGDFADAFQNQYRVNFGVIEAIAAIGLILVYQPLRQRCAEALDYLFGASSELRGENRNLSVQLASRSGERSYELLTWFVQAAQASFQVESVSAIILRSDKHEVYSTDPDLDLRQQTARALYRQMQASSMRTCTLHNAPDKKSLLALQEANASAALRIDCPNRPGLLLVGTQRYRQSLREEQFNALSLLVEQLGVTLQNADLQAARLDAERRAVQQEKLSTLGLVAGSIAHEVKNPLSSIKSIATVLAEELGSTSPHAEDLRLILGEIDRLALTASQLLDIARTPVHAPQDGLLQHSLRQTTHLLSHLARQHHSQIVTNVPDQLPAVAVDEGTLREIFLNLIANSIEATGPAGQIRVTCRLEGESVVTEVRDNGPGLPDAVRERLFEPLVTTKEAGTGLGLYIVGLRVRECGGDVTCETSPETGTTFFVRLPFAPVAGECGGD